MRCLPKDRNLLSTVYEEGFGSHRCTKNKTSMIDRPIRRLRSVRPRIGYAGCRNVAVIKGRIKKKKGAFSLHIRRLIKLQIILFDYAIRRKRRAHNLETKAQTNSAGDSHGIRPYHWIDSNPEMYAASFWLITICERKKSPDFRFQCSSLGRIPKNLWSNCTETNSIPAPSSSLLFPSP